MGKGKQAKKLVPKKLYAELIDYESLLRALRTEATQSASSPLVFAAGPSANRAQIEVEPPIETISGDEESLDDQEEDNENIGYQSRATSSSQGPSSKRPPRKRRNIEPETSLPSFPDITSLSSRWPHLVHETFVPEYTLRDEVEALALSVLRSQTSASRGMGSERSRLPENNSSEEIVEDDYNDSSNTTALPPAFTSALTQEISLLLTHVFALLAHHRPVAASSLQNRLAPIGWESLLDIVANGGMIPSRWSAIGP